jgi:hypothetical protein
MRKLPKKSTKLYGLLPDPLPKRYMVVRLRFDREAFDSLKELLREKIALPSNRHVRTTDPATPVTSALAREEPISGRLTREALKRVFDQIRDVEYNDV